MPFITLARHWGYGLILALFIPIATQRVATLERHDTVAAR